jgi:hypothetical protein
MREGGMEEEREEGREGGRKEEGRNSSKMVVWWDCPDPVFRLGQA